MGDNATPTSFRCQPVPDGCPALLQIDAIQRPATEHHVNVPWLDQRELDLVAALAALSYSTRQLYASASVTGAQSEKYKTTGR
jgi:hypothetical protein